MREGVQVQCGSWGDLEKTQKTSQLSLISIWRPAPDVFPFNGLSSFFSMKCRSNPPPSLLPDVKAKWKTFSEFNYKICRWLWTVSVMCCVMVNTLHFSPTGQAKPSVMKTPPGNWGRDHLMIDHPQQAQLTNLSRRPTGNRQQLSIIQRLTFLPLLIYISSVR